MLPDPKVKCPATAFARSCREIVVECDCPKFVNVRGQNPQTGETIDRFGCVDAFLPLLLIENAKLTAQAGAAIESFRNEVVASNEAAVQERQNVLANLPKRSIG